MFRPSRVLVLAFVCAASPALAEENEGPPNHQPSSWLGGERVMVVTPHDGFSDGIAHETSPYIYLNRCIGGCSVMSAGVDDARAMQSRIPKQGSGCPGFPTCSLSEFATVDGAIGNNGKCRGGTAQGTNCTDANEASVCTGGGTCYSANDEWELVVQCMKEVYSPFGVMVTDQPPAGGISHTMAIIAGKAGQIGWNGALGVAPIAGDCSPKDNVISFSFANDHGATDRVFNLCWTAAQETAHAFGLDHSYQFSDGTSACNDPMTYRFDCGGQKFFRNKAAQCGEDAIRPCSCGGSQNSHLKIKGIFGEGQSLIPAPTLAVTSPQPNTTVQNGAVVTLSAGSKRGIERVELWLNNYKWAETAGAAFGRNGQPNPSNYSLMFPAGVPNGITDIVVKAFDDIGEVTTSPTITVTKGAPCADASTCADGQRCEAGKCFWDPPVGQLGETCTYQQYCESNLCVETNEGGLCSQECILGAADACPMGFDCVPFGNFGACVAADDGGGCCSVGESSSNELWLHGGLSALILGFVIRRRRKR